MHRTNPSSSAKKPIEAKPKPAEATPTKPKATAAKPAEDKPAAAKPIVVTKPNSASNPTATKPMATKPTATSAVSKKPVVVSKPVPVSRPIERSKSVAPRSEETMLLSAHRLRKSLTDACRILYVNAQYDGTDYTTSREEIERRLPTLVSSVKSSLNEFYDSVRPLSASGRANFAMLVLALGKLHNGVTNYERTGSMSLELFEGCAEFMEHSHEIDAGRSEEEETTALGGARRVIEEDVSGIRKGFVRSRRGDELMTRREEALSSFSGRAGGGGAMIGFGADDIDGKDVELPRSAVPKYEEVEAETLFAVSTTTRSAFADRVRSARR